MPHSALTLSVALLPKPITRHCIDCSCLGIECRQHNTYITHRVLQPALARGGVRTSISRHSHMPSGDITRNFAPGTTSFYASTCTYKAAVQSSRRPIFFLGRTNRRGIVWNMGIVESYLLYLYTRWCAGNRKFSAKSRLCVTFSAFFSSHTGEPLLRLF